MQPFIVVRNDLNGQARVRTVNWVLGAPPLTVTDSADRVFARGLGWIGIQDVEFEPGTYDMSVSGDDNVFWTGTLDLEADTSVALLLIGDPDGDPPVRALPVVNSADSTRVRFVNNRSDTVDIHVRPGNERVVESLRPGETSEYVSLPSGAVTFVAYQPGTGPTGQEQASLIDTIRPGRDVTVTLRNSGQMTISNVEFTP
jgi:hypothetical protein